VGAGVVGVAAAADDDDDDRGGRSVVVFAVGCLVGFASMSIVPWLHWLLQPRLPLQQQGWSHHPHWCYSVVPMGVVRPAADESTEVVGRGMDAGRH